MAAAVIALAACNKEKEEIAIVPEETAALKITVKASPDEIKGDAETKTYIDDKTIRWGTGEYMQIGVFDGTATTWGKSDDATADLWDGDTEALFTFDITLSSASGEYTYYGLYPFSSAVSSNNDNAANYKVILPNTQNATASSYDPKAYILVARPESGKTVASADWEAAFRRATALNKITLKNIPEDIKRVTITAPAGVKMAGRRYIDLTTGASGNIYDGTNKVDIKFATKLTGGANMDVWFTSWDTEIAVDSKLTIVAYSNEHTYTRELTVVNKPITFKEGYLNTLNVNMASAVVGDNTELADGDYLILAKNNTNYYALKGEATGTRLVSVNYTGNLSSYTGSGDIVWSIAASGDSYTVKNGTNYLGWTGDNSASLIADAGYTDETCLMDITYNEGTYLLSVHGNSSRKLARNNSNAYFAFYGGTQYKDIVFVPATIDTRTAVTLSFDNNVVNVLTTNYGSFLGQDVKVSPNETAIINNIAWSYEDNDGVIDDFDDGVLSLTGTVGTATVTASFAGDENYLPADNKSYTINVVAPYTASEAYDAATTTEVSGVYVTGIVSAITTAFNSNKVSFTISDDGLTSGKQFTAFSTSVESAADVAVGDGVVLYGTLIKYNNTTPELKSGNTIVSSLRMPAFTSGDENFETHTSVTLSAAAGATLYYTTDGTTPTTSSTVYSSAIAISSTTTIKAIAAKDGLVTGVASKTFTKASAYAITWSDPSNGSITVKHGETTLTSGNTVLTGETITIITTPADGYSLSTLVYNDGSDHDIKTSKSFTMPDHAVTLTATFAAGGGISKGATKVYSISTSTKSDQSFNKLIGNSTSSGNYNHASSKSITLDNHAWTITTTGNGSVVYAGGQQLGAGVKDNVTRDITSVTMSSSAYTGGIETITVSSGTNGSATLAVYVDGVQVETSKSVGSGVTYTLTSIATGTITLVWTQTTAGKNLTIQSIQIN